MFMVRSTIEIIIMKEEENSNYIPNYTHNDSNSNNNNKTNQ